MMIINIIIMIIIIVESVSRLKIKFVNNITNNLNINGANYIEIMEEFIINY